MGLSQEFIYVLLMFAMRRVTNEEMLMARFSTGNSIHCSPWEMCHKMALHRMQDLIHEGGDYFKKRMVSLSARDATFGMRKQMANPRAVDHIKSVGGVSGT